MRGRKIEAKIERLFRDREDFGREGAEDGKKRDCTKAKKQAEPVVTLLKKTKHTQVNYYPYKSLTTACSHNYNSHQLFVTSAEDELGNTDTDIRRGGGRKWFTGTFVERGVGTLLELGETVVPPKVPSAVQIFHTACLFL